MRYCAAARRCLDQKAGPDGVKRAAAIDVEHGLCETCTGHIRRHCVEAWTDDFDALRIMLGERQSGGADKIKYTPNPGIPLATEPEKLMVDLVFYAGLAADMVSDHLGMDYRPYKGKGHPLRHRSELGAAGNRVGPYLEKLLEVPAQAVMLWATGEAIDQKPVEWQRIAPRKYVPIDAHGRQIVARGRVLVDLSGVDVALKLRDLHELVRGLYGARGKDRSDHMQSPCHKCGNQSLYRDHGTDLIRCRKCPPHSEGDRGWNRDDFDRLVGNTRFFLKVREEAEMEKIKELELAIAEMQQRAESAESAAAQRLTQLEKAATVAGFSDVESFAAALERVSA